MKRLLIFTVLAAFLPGSAFADLPMPGAETLSPIEKNKLTIMHEENISPELARIQEHFIARRWDDAFRIIQKTRSKYGDSIVRVGPNRLRGVNSYLRDLLNRLPSEGLGAYRRAFGLQAEALFYKAFATRDIRLFEILATEYFLSQYADEALMAIAYEASARGDYRRAANAIHRIISSYPDPSFDKSVLVVALGEAYRNLGNPEKIDELVLTAPEGDVTIGGRKVSCRKLLKRYSAQAAKFKRSMISFRAPWTTLGGSPSRDRVAPVDLSLGRRITDIPMPGFTISPIMPRGFYIHRIGFDPSRNKKAFPFFPAFDGKLVYFANGKRLIIIDVATGIVKERKTLSRVRTPERNKEIVYSPTLAGESIFISLMGDPWIGEKHRQIDVTIEIPRRFLPAFDTKSWKKTFDPQKVQRQVISFERLIFASPPAVRQKKVFITVNSLRGFVDNYVLAFDRLTGDLAWRKAICSNIIEITAFGYHAREPVPPMLTEHDGVLYALTNLGALAALDSETGKVLWEAEYHQIKVKPPIRYTPQMRKYIWQPSPAVVSGDVVIVAPTDSPHLYGFDKNSGSLKWCVPRAEMDCDVNHFLGVSNGLAVVAGEKVMAFDVLTGKLRWQTPAIIYMKESGRGLLSTTSVYHPTADHLCRFDLKTGKLKERWKWSDPGDAGNVFFFGSHIVTTSQTGISIFEGTSQ